jgi:hypothetical protein
MPIKISTFDFAESTSWTVLFEMNFDPEEILTQNPLLIFVLAVQKPKILPDFLTHLVNNTNSFQRNIKTPKSISKHQDQT